MKTTFTANYRVPVGLAGASLIFWGMVTGHWVAAVPLAVLIEARCVIKERWEIDDQLLSRIWTLCMVIGLVLVVIGLVREGIARAAYFAIEWTPVAGLPLLLVQIYGTREGIPTRILSLLARMMEKSRVQSGRPPSGGEQLLNIEYPYVCAVVTAAAAPQPEGGLFYAGAVALVIGGLFLNGERPRLNPVVWLAAVLAVAGIGYAGHVGLHGLHVHLENMAVGMNADGPSADVNRSVTRLGAVGDLKLSKRIDWWATPIVGEVPSLLKRAAFDTYHRETWFVSRGRDLVPATRQAAGAAPDWIFASPGGAASNQVLGLVGRRHGAETQLSLPGGTLLTLAGLAAEEVRRSGMGLTVATAAPLVLDFKVEYRMASGVADLPAGKADLAVPKPLDAGLKRVLDRLGADGKPPREVVGLLMRFFMEQFQYSTSLDVSTSAGDPVVAFLETHRKGHCEYFATATALLLRQAGIPARYVTGYVLQEYDPRRGHYVVRGLHAHAWVQVWLDDRWEFVDTTPGSWLQADSQALSFWQPQQDWFQGLPMVWSIWIKGPLGSRVLGGMKWTSLPLLAVYLWFRLFHGRRGRRVRDTSTGDRDLRQGVNSEWYMLEAVLTARVGGRSPGEPLCAWWRRVGGGCPEPVRVSIGQALELHYRLRFDPEPLTAEQRSRLRTLALSAKESLESDQPGVP